ncbi:MAG: hypothetical protein V2B19_22530 [Pseudomonadota bacterium]
MGNGEEIRGADTGRAETVYLCQVSDGVSCGACCGLYNIKNLSKTKLEAMLAERTEAFASVSRTEEGIDGFRIRVEGVTPAERPFPEFHHCPFLGLIGPDKSRVGCMLHPAASGNDGKDFRWLSWYGAMACRIYFCPTHRILPPAYQMIVREAFDHWYFYGLIVTEHRLLTAFFAELEKRLSRCISSADFMPDSEAATLFRELASLKIVWPHRRNGAPGPCHYMFENGEYDRPEIQRENPEIPLSHYETIFRELDSKFDSLEDMRHAEMRLDKFFENLMAALG